MKALSLLLVLVPLLGSCALLRSDPFAQDPTVVIESDDGSELGLVTDYGIVFLGRTRRAGDIHVRSWFADGPNLETTAVEPIGGGLYTAETEIRLANMPLTFIQPPAGEEVILRGRRDGDLWQTTAKVARHPKVEGLLIEVANPLENRDDQVGAGIFVRDEQGRMRALGLVSGWLRLTTESGTRDFMTVAGPESLWRLVAHRRDLSDPPRWVYREDIL